MLFGAYAVQFLHEGSQEEHLILLYALGIIAVMTLFNSLSNHAVGRLEVILVGIKMMILLLLIIAGVWSAATGAYFRLCAPQLRCVLLLYRDNLPCLCGLWHDGERGG
ncbi:putative amino acid permease [Escherichia coli]|uniref:Putative amino acid permease n=1 Tax=Escherichia coli TaxID=562 RepID=A0A2X3M4S1_ECOLX|nr:putative amino acid permease [Escherichia coli]